ncbi:ERMES complex subunit [Arachnomyces sp. PD_36]|nr:ERMES complex subunit [Arachnomyces sp. PD_36]
MAFNFNWSPLIADAGFYTRAQELLTTALNKSPKPPIIVDDILVTELNLGSIPPELEILEIGDLAEDRFRGIFKMCYSGDAYLTLKTRVQANPLNTYLLTRPSFASPQPLAADTGLTIPLQITLSEIKLSGFIVLVFSKQKGITIVFRNDPLESLKVSSTFDSIPFVRDYLQKEIEGQLRILFMDELPAIIHRLSLRLWVPDYREREGEEITTGDNIPTEGPTHDPLASPPQDPVDASGNVLDPSEISSLSLDSGVETHSLFSQRNLLRLAALTNSQRTLSLFTPSIRDVVFRAWTGPAELGEGLGSLNSPMSPALSRTHSHVASSVYSFQDMASASSNCSRPSLPSSNHSGYGLGMGASRHSKPYTSKKRKKRVVDLRHLRPNNDNDSSSTESTATESTDSPAVFSPPPTIPEGRNDDPVTPPQSPQNTVRRPTVQERRRMTGSLSTRSARNAPRRAIPTEFYRDPATQTAPSPVYAEADETRSPIQPAGHDATPRATVRRPNIASYPAEKSEAGPSSSAPRSMPQAMLPFMDPSQTGGILEQAFMMKMAGEIARRMQEEKSGGMGPTGGSWNQSGREEIPPPPAYGQ